MTAQVIFFNVFSKKDPSLMPLRLETFIQIRYHCVKGACIKSSAGPHFPTFRLNTDQNNSEYRHFLRSVYLYREYLLDSQVWLVRVVLPDIKFMSEASCFLKISSLIFIIFSSDFFLNQIIYCFLKDHFKFHFFLFEYLLIYFRDDAVAMNQHIFLFC